MSSYIIGAKQYNSIEKSIQNLLKDDRFNSYGLKEFGLYKYELVPKMIPSIIKGLIDGVRELNVLCYYMQYKHHYKGNLDQEIQLELKEIKQNTEIVNLEPLQLYDVLTTVIYQIELNHLEDLRKLTQEEKKAYYFLETIINCTAKHICNKLL